MSGFTCKCGAKVVYPLYVHAHWDDPLLYTRENCKAKYTILHGKARLMDAACKAKREAKP